VRATVADAPLVSGSIVTAMSRGSTVSFARQNQCPSASAETYDRLVGETVPVMADDSMLDALDLASLELTAPA